MLNNIRITRPDKKIFKNVILPRLEKGERTNIFFSTNYYSGSYYYLYQFWVLSQFSRYKNIHFYISHTDTVSVAGAHMHFSVRTAKKENIPADVNLMDIKSVLKGFGVPENRIHLYKSSELWFKYMSHGSQNILNFYKGMSVFPLKSLKMSLDWTKNWYLPETTSIGVAYGIQKYMDLLVCSSFHKLFPDEIEGKIDIVLVGSLASQFSLDVRKNLAKEELIKPDMPVVMSVQKIPVFGHTVSIHKEFVTPNWRMEVEQVYNIIEKSKVPQKHILELFDAFLNKCLDEFILVNRKKQITLTKSPPAIDGLPAEIQRLTLAHNLYKFLKNVKTQHMPEESKSHLFISREKELIELGKLLKNKTALNILRLANGQHTSSDIARKLNKHASNIHPLIKKLKVAGLVRKNRENKLVRKINKVNIDLPFKGEHD